MEYNQKSIVNRAALMLCGVPYKFRGQDPVLGLDCLYSIFWILDQANIVESDQAGRNRYRPTEGLVETGNRGAAFIEKVLHVEVTTEPETGDIAVFKSGRFCSHLAIIVAGGRAIGHVLANREYTVEPLKKWRDNIAVIYRIKSQGYRTDPREVTISELEPI